MYAVMLLLVIVSALNAVALGLLYWRVRQTFDAMALRDEWMWAETKRRIRRVER